MVEDLVVEPQHTAKYLNLFSTKYLPRAKKRTMDLVACWHTPTDIGEDVHIAIIWSMRDWEHWDQVRFDALFDPWESEWLKEVKPMWEKGSTRRFFLPAEFSPLK